MIEIVSNIDNMIKSICNGPSMGFSRQEYWSGVPLPSSPDIAKCPPRGRGGADIACLRTTALRMYTQSSWLI